MTLAPASRDATRVAESGDPRAVMRLHVDVLFTHDDRHRLVRVNEPDGGPAPRFYLGRTDRGHIWRVRHDVDEQTVNALVAFAEAELPDDVRRAPARPSPYEEILARTAPVERVWSGPAYRFSTGAAPPGDSVVRIAEGSVRLLTTHLESWIDGLVHRQPCYVALEGGVAVAICCSVRRTDAAHEAGVETHPSFRKRGHARRVAAAWADAVRRGGAEPLYSTSWDNDASQALALSLGLVRYGSDFHVR